MLFSFSVLPEGLNRRDSPALLSDEKVNKEIMDYASCIRGEPGVSAVLRDLRSGAFYLFNSSYEARPDHAVLAWFRFFENEEYVGLLEKYAKSNENELKTLSTQIDNTLKTVKNIVERDLQVIQLIDLGMRKNMGCRVTGIRVIDQVNRQYDLANSWIDAVEFAKRSALLWNGVRNRRTEVEKLYDNFTKKRDALDKLK